MRWEDLISAKRWLPLPPGTDPSLVVPGNEPHNRTEFERDYDRLIFSSPFRRLQNKTQVFPLPGSVFVHNRLTHTLEVASIGRSLGRTTGYRLQQAGDLPAELAYHLGDIVAAACLAHDLGNPPFGHGGEDAISAFFQDNKGRFLHLGLTTGEWYDLADFEGNANTFRLLTHSFGGRRPGGYALTYATLAATVKYPTESTGRDKTAGVARKKYNIFQEEKPTLTAIFQSLGLPQLSQSPLIYPRHPLVFLVEAADDSCNLIVDLEDAHRLGILSTVATQNLLLAFFAQPQQATELRQIHTNLGLITDPREQIAYLRGRVLHRLTLACADAFWDNRDAILALQFNQSIFAVLPDALREPIDAIQALSTDQIYNEPQAVAVEISGYRVLHDLLEAFTDALLAEDPTRIQQKLLRLLPGQFNPGPAATPYQKLLAITDFVSGMTDVYAIDLYRRLFGIARPDMH